MFDVGQRVVCVETAILRVRSGDGAWGRGALPFCVGDKFTIRGVFPAGTHIPFSEGGLAIVNVDSVAIGVGCDVLGVDAWPADFFAPIEGLDISQSLAALKGLFDRLSGAVDA